MCFGHRFPLAGIVLATLALAARTHPQHQAVVENDFSLVSSIRDTLRDNDIIDDVLDDFEPQYYLDITYPKHHETVMLGNDIPVKAVSKRPAFTFHSLLSRTGEDKNSTLTLVLTDPDATSRDDPKLAEMCHWIVTNLTAPISEIPPRSERSGELEEYLPPRPPEKTGRHRYVFVLLEGDTTDIKPPKERVHWGYGKIRHGVRDWAQENGLDVVGANFFFAQNKKQ